jgi:hypothetical protein
MQWRRGLSFSPLFQMLFCYSFLEIFPWPLDSLKWASLNLSDWIKDILNPHNFFGIPFADSHLFQIFATMLRDMLWFSRNQAIHKGVLPEVLANIKCVFSEHFPTWSLKLHPKNEIWFKPPQDCCKVNFHAAFRETFSTQAAVCKNHKGEIIKTLTLVRPPCNQVNGEAQAAKRASVLASSLQLDEFILEGESFIVVLALQNPAFRLDFHFEYL